MNEYQISIFDGLEHAPAETVPTARTESQPDFESYCPVCGAQLIAVKCKVICRSELCVYRLVFNCSEF